MATCKVCLREMTDPDTITCTASILIVADQDGFIRERFWRNSSYFDEGERCHDCQILNIAGNYHHWGCDMERCPKCGLQLISCDCFEGKKLEVTSIPDWGGHPEDIKTPVKEVE